MARHSHSLFRRSVSLALAVLVLITSVGLTVQRLTCRMSGTSKVDVSVGGGAALRGCDGLMAPSAPRLKDNCCDFSRQLHKLTAPAHELATGKVPVPPPLLAAWLPEAGWRAAPGSTAPHELAGPRWFAADASPPPRGGRGLLVFVCTLVV